MAANRRPDRATASPDRLSVDAPQPDFPARPAPPVRLTHAPTGVAPTGVADVPTPAAALRILVVDDEWPVRTTLSGILDLHGYETVEAGGAEEALACLGRQEVDLVVIDLQLGGSSGLALLRQIRRLWPETMAIVLTGYASLDSAIDALHAGAFAYLTKPCDIEDLKVTVQRALERRQLSLALAARIDELRGANDALRDLSEALQQRIDDATCELRQQMVDLDRAKQQLEVAQRQREQFISLIVHDLRNPLTTLLGYAHLLGEGARSPAVQQRARTLIASSAQRMARLIDDLSEAVEVAAGQFRLRLRACDLTALAVEQVELAETRAEQAAPALVDAPHTVLATIDHDRIAQVLANLLDNAVKYAPGGRVRVHVWSEPASGAGGAARARVSVADEGPGIPADALETVFEPHVRLVKNAPGQPKGSGLGLFISRGIVEAHGGRIWAEPAPDRGTVFHVELPAAVETAAGSSVAA